MRARSLAVLVLAAALLPGCKYFSDTTIPFFDFDDPVAWSSVYQGGTYTKIWSAPGGNAHAISNPNEVFWILSATMDDGGARRVTQGWSVHQGCTSWDGKFGKSITSDGVALTETQSGSVGDTVSDGVWTGRPLKFADLMVPCGYGYVMSSLSVSWTTTAEDFAGNKRTSTGRVRYGS